MTEQIANTGAPVQSPEIQGQTPTAPIQGGDVATTPIPITEYEIEGLGKVKIDDIKEWKQGYLRQSDYTKKTQSIAAQKKEMQDAIDLYNYFKKNPQIAQQVANGQPINPAGTPLEKMNPVTGELEEVRRELSTMKLDNELNRLKGKYSDFNEVEVLEKADELGVEDLEFVYKALKGDKVDTLADSIRKQVEAELLQKIQANNSATQTIISPTDQTAKGDFGLTPEEVAICEKAGWNKEAYAKSKMR
jgi:hypothetical protein